MLLSGDGRAVRAGLACRAGQALASGIPVIVVIALVDRLQEGTVTRRAAGAYGVVLVTGLVLQLWLGYRASGTLWPTSIRLGAALRHRAALHAVRRPLSEHDRGRTGDDASVITDDIAAVQDFVGWTLPTTVTALVQPVVVLLALLAVDPWLAAAAASSVGIAAPVFVWSLRLWGGMAYRRQALRGDLAGAVVEHVEGLGVMRAFGLGPVRTFRLAGVLDDLRSVERRLMRAIAPTYHAAMTVVELGLAIVVTAVAHRIAGAGVDAGTAAIALVLLLRLYEPLRTVAMQVELLPVVDASAERIASFLGAGDPPRPDPDIAPPRTRQVQRASVTLEGVRFAYPGGRDVLQDIDLRAPVGGLTAIVGPSGAGKSTILRLVAGLYAPTGGRVTIGGRDLAELSPAERFQLVSAVFQDVRLFTGTIRHNLTLGAPDLDDEQIDAAVRSACCGDLLARLPDGYDTMLGEDGAGLSGGERQRLTIARAILKDAPVVLLDEPTAAVDPTNARLIQDALRALVTDRTVIVVAHRLSTIRSADRIVVLDAGQIVQVGDHETLLEQDGRYAEFWASRERAAAWTMGGPPTGDHSTADSTHGGRRPT